MIRSIQAYNQGARQVPYFLTIADKPQMTMKHTPVKYELVELINDPLDSNSGYHTIKDYYRIYTEGQNYYDFSTGEGFNITGHISEQNAKLLASAPALESQVKELREALAHSTELVKEGAYWADKSPDVNTVNYCDHCDLQLKVNEQLLNKQP